ncbi:PREDICTED: uncharacterized protein LOC102761440 [Myotis davidii]|uniref:uncharacterized protein LOC102761440 n=1 Tax=Myotis davidii TaxID=225400 RepID=UPI000766F427|nr:PREDICTED: uncharacterized protein LOC102761440 [Myotis davidii]
MHFLRSLRKSLSVVSPPQPGSERPRLFTAAPRRSFSGSSISGSSQDPAAVPLEAPWGSCRSRAPPSSLHPLSRCRPAGEPRKPPGELKVVAGGGQRGCCSPGGYCNCNSDRDDPAEAPGAASPGGRRWLPLSSPPFAAAGPRPSDSGPGRTGLRRPGFAHFTAALLRGMRAWWLQVAAEQLPVGEPGERGGGSLGPNILWKNSE